MKAWQIGWASPSLPSPIVDYPITCLVLAWPADQAHAPRAEGRDTASSLAVRDAQYDAVLDWGIPDHGALQRLTGIKTPTLIIQGDNDLMIPTRLSYLMAGLIPDATLRIYPDAAYASLFQYPEQAAADVNTFLG